MQPAALRCADADVRVALSRLIGTPLSDNDRRLASLILSSGQFLHVPQPGLSASARLRVKHLEMVLSFWSQTRERLKVVSSHERTVTRRKTHTEANHLADAVQDEHRQQQILTYSSTSPLVVCTHHCTPTMWRRDIERNMILPSGFPAPSQMPSLVGSMYACRCQGVGTPQQARAHSRFVLFVGSRTFDPIGPGRRLSHGCGRGLHSGVYAQSHFDSSRSHFGSSHFGSNSGFVCFVRSVFVCSFLVMRVGIELLLLGHKTLERRAFG